MIIDHSIFLDVQPGKTKMEIVDQVVDDIENSTFHITLADLAITKDDVLAGLKGNYNIC